MKTLEILAILVLGTSLSPAATEKPNILWLVQEDTSPWMACYGHGLNAGWTPHVDKLAAGGVRFSRAYVPAPVCSACRSSFIVGASQIRFGAHEHRSRRGKAALPLPEGMKTLPELMREVGYFTFNVGKTDYNFSEAKGGIYSGVSRKISKTPWRECPDGKRFFGQIQLKGGKLNVAKRPAEKNVDPAKVTVPADYPQNQLYREVVAEHYNSIRGDDENIGAILENLKADGLLASTIVVYFSDHGANNLVRHKQMATEAGLHVPCMISGPEKWVPAGQVRDDLVSILDISATTLVWGGVPLPEWVEGRDLFAEDFKPREFVASARDRCDSTIERVRTIRTDRFRYTRNFFLDRVFLQPQYRDPRPFLVFLRKAYADGSLDPKLAKIYFGERPAEELYEIGKDPAQVNNLAGKPECQEILEHHRKLMDQWLAKGDMGEGTEPDIELVMNDQKKWGRGVNPEYERIREDRDGDGLSDDWEKLNGRDAADGRLQFEFDCGGWQTEGWQARGILTNIAGMQGYLEFDLREGKGAITRKGLKLDASKNLGTLVVRLRSTDPKGLTLDLTANGRTLGSANAAAGRDFTEVSIPLDPSAWKGTIKDLRLQFSAAKMTTVEIDWIRVKGD